jgi:GNAT superfamily N-acetyltransferase
MRTREFRPTDRTACLALFDSNVPEYFHAAERVPFLEFLESPGGPFRVVEMDPHGVVGCGGWYVDGAVAGLTWGIVGRANHGRGLGRFLLQERLQAIRADGRASLVRVRTTPSVQGFFEHAGFSVVREGVAGVVDEMPLVEMMLRL